jgi:PAS domain S-box-containing protein
VGEGIMVLDADGSVQVMNPTAASIFGRQPSQAAGMHVDELLTTDDDALRGYFRVCGPR